MTRDRLPNRRASETQEFVRDGVNVKMTVGFQPSGQIGELLLNTDRADSMLDVLLSDAAIICSLALQHGVQIQQMAHSVKRDKFGLASSPIGAALDRIGAEVLK